MKHFELTPCDSHKSFYGKARVIEHNGEATLYSYNTRVCVIELLNRRVVRCWMSYSATTMRHVNSFLQHYGLPKLSKAEWEKLDYMQPTSISA